MSPTSTTTPCRSSTASPATVASSPAATTPAATIPVGSAPIGIFADGSNHTVYVGNFADGTVSMIDSASCNGAHAQGCPSVAPPTVRVTDNPGDIDVNQRTHTAYVATTSGLTAFDTRTCNATTSAGCGNVGTFHLCSYPDCFGPFSAKVDPENNTIYEGNGDTTVVAIDGSTCNADHLSDCTTVAYGSVTLPDPGFGDHILSIAVDVSRHSVYALLQKDDAAVVIDADVCNGSHPSACATLDPPQIHTGANPQSIAVDQRTHTLYVANQADNTLSVIDASRCNAAVTTGCFHRPPATDLAAPGGIAADATVHTVYVASGTHDIAMIDSRDCNAYHPRGCDQAPPTATVGDLPAAIAIDDTTHTAYIANQGSGPSGTVTLLDTHACNAHRTHCATAATLQVPAGHPSDIAVNTTTGTIYVATATSAGSDVISVFDATTCNAATTTGCGQLPATMTVGPSSGCSSLAITVAEATDTIYATDTTLCATPFLGDQIYVYDGTNCRSAHTTACGNPVATITAGLNPYDVAVDEATSTLYAPLLADGEQPGYVAVIDAATCNGSNTAGCAQPPALAPVGFGPIAAAIDPTTDMVFVTNIQDTTLSVIDVKRCNGTGTDRCDEPTDKLAVDDYPSSIAIDPTVGTAFVRATSRARSASSGPGEARDVGTPPEKPCRCGASSEPVEVWSSSLLRIALATYNRTAPATHAPRHRRRGRALRRSRRPQPQWCVELDATSQDPRPLPRRRRRCRRLREAPPGACRRARRPSAHPGPGPRCCRAAGASGSADPRHSRRSPHATSDFRARYHAVESRLGHPRSAGRGHAARRAEDQSSQPHLRYQQSSRRSSVVARLGAGEGAARAAGRTLSIPPRTRGDTRVNACPGRESNPHVLAYRGF